MYGQHRKIDPVQVMAFKRRGLSNTQIARRLGVTAGAIYHVLRKEKSNVTGQAGSDRDERGGVIGRMRS